jgi:RNA polymerase sigma factor (sigma-70 family)
LLSAEHQSTAEQATLRDLGTNFRTSLQRYFARRVRNEGEIEDLVQEVFLRLLKRGGMADMEHLHGYMFQTARSVLADHLRRRRIFRTDDHEEFDESAHGGLHASPEDALLGRERLARATALLLELPERTRVIFVLRRLEGMRYDDIALHIGVSVSAVEKHMQRAVAHLTDAYEQP